METKKTAGLSISKSKGYGQEFNILVPGLDKERLAKFNKGGKVTVTKEELKTIGKHRWLEVSNG